MYLNFSAWNPHHGVVATPWGLPWTAPGVVQEAERAEESRGRTRRDNISRLRVLGPESLNSLESSKL